VLGVQRADDTLGGKDTDVPGAERDV
jgi:hypothetical protein